MECHMQSGSCRQGTAGRDCRQGIARHCKTVSCRQGLQAGNCKQGTAEHCKTVSSRQGLQAGNCRALQDSELQARTAGTNCTQGTAGQGADKQLAAGKDLPGSCKTVRCRQRRQAGNCGADLQDSDLQDKQLPTGPPRLLGAVAARTDLTDLNACLLLIIPAVASERAAQGCAAEATALSAVARGRDILAAGEVQSSSQALARKQRSFCVMSKLQARVEVNVQPSRTRSLHAQSLGQRIRYQFLLAVSILWHSVPL